MRRFGFFICISALSDSSSSSEYFDAYDLEYGFALAPLRPVPLETLAMSHKPDTLPHESQPQFSENLANVGSKFISFVKDISDKAVKGVKGRWSCLTPLDLEPALLTLTLTLVCFT